MRVNFNLRRVFRILGILLIFESLLLFAVCPVALYYGEGDLMSFFNAGVLALVTGGVMSVSGWKASKHVTKREGAVIVSSVWVLFSLFGMLPFLFSGALSSVSDALFESMSGFTACGATVMTHIDEMPHGILFWRSLMQWVGGIGIIMISLALLPIFGFSGTMLFGAEFSGPTKEKLSPKVSGTAKRLGMIYLGLTLAQIVCLNVAGMNVFDSVCHSMTTAATGGFSTHQASIAYFHNPLFECIIILFMFLSGVNYTLYWYAFSGKFRRKVLHNGELYSYLSLVLLFFAIMVFFMVEEIHLTSFGRFGDLLRDCLFQVVSIITTTGFTTTDYMSWPSLTWIMIFLLMFFGANAGSSSGGIKVVRIVIAFKYCYYEFKRMVHPNAVIPISYNGSFLRTDVVTRVLAFILLYIIVVVVCMIVLSFTGMGALEAVGAAVACLGTIGPAFGDLGPSGTFAAVPEFCKYFLSFVMLIGRLELFTVLLLFTPVFWSR